MKPSFRIAGRIAKPVSEVFEAVVNPDRLSAYFTTGGAQGRLETGVTVYWDFADFPGKFPVRVAQVQKDREIVLTWPAHEEGEVSSTGQMPEPANYETTVIFRFEPLDDGRTLVTISETGWRETPGAVKASYGNCEGWTQMLCALKGWLEHRINLREGFYR